MRMVNRAVGELLPAFLYKEARGWGLLAYPSPATIMDSNKPGNC